MRRAAPLFAALLSALTWARAGTGAFSADTVQVLELPGGWSYAPAAEGPALDRLPAAWQAAALPHRLGTEPCGFYRSTCPVPMAWTGRRIALVVRRHRGAVWAWANGQALGVRAPTALDVRLDATQAIRPGAANTLLIAVSDPGDLDRGGLTACWLEAGPAIALEPIALSARPAGDRAIVDARLTATNGTPERFEGKLEVALEPDAESKDHPVWRRDSDVRLDPSRSQSVQHSWELERPRLWRFDDPFLYRLTATVRDRSGQAVSTEVRRLGVRRVEAADGRWFVNGDWARLAGVALAAPGATLLCPQPGQAAAALARLVPGQEAPLGELLDFCDEQGIVVLLDAPARSDAAAGWREALGDLAAAAGTHPCAWGWVVTGEPGAASAALALLRNASDLPVGCPMPDVAADARGFDFVLARYGTKADRPDNDGYGRRMDDLRDDAAGKALIAIDRIEPEAAGDRKAVEDSLRRRRDEAGRRWQIGHLFFDLGRDEGLLRLAADRFCPFSLKPPNHEARLDKDQIVLKTRFEGDLSSPVAGRMPCHSLEGCRIAWQATSRGGDAPPAAVASGTVELKPSRPRPIDGGNFGAFREEIEWRGAKPGDLAFVAELQDAAGRVLARDSRTLSLKVNKDKVELKVGPPPKPEAAQPVGGASQPRVPVAAIAHLALPFDNDAIAWRANPADGNFDLAGRGAGDAFIADLLPKAGALVALPGNDAITFPFPSKDDRARNNVVCDGQRVLAPEGGAAFDAAWFLGACHGGSGAALLTLEYADGEARAELRLADWCSKPEGGEIDVLRTPARLTPEGKEEATDCGLVAWRVPLDPKRKLLAITLPRERSMHVFAATLTRTGNP